MKYKIFFLAGGLIPCGGAGQPACDFCQFAVLLNNVIHFLLFNLTLPVSVVALIFAGIIFLMAGDNPQQITKGRNIFTFTVTGIAIAFGAWLIINTILGNLLQYGYIPGWTQFPSCTLF